MKVKFYQTLSGRSPVEEFLSDLSDSTKNDFLDALILLESGLNIPFPLSRNLFSLQKGLHELRIKDREGAYRFFYFIKKDCEIYFLHAFKKKTQQLPKKEIELVLDRLKKV